MGTAPDSDQHPAMPDPERVVTSAVTVITRQGYSKRQALAIVNHVAYEVTRLLREAGHPDANWIWSIVRVSHERATALAPSVNDSQGGTSGDGPGRTASGAAEQEDRTPQG